MAVRLETPDFLDRAGLLAVAEREVSATPARVFDALADASSWEHWFPNMRRCRFTTGAPHGVGSRRKVKVGALQVEEEFIVWEPGRRWGFTFVDVNIPFARAGVEIVDLIPAGDDRCHVRYSMAIDPTLGLKLFAGPFRAGAERGLRDGLAALDDYLEV